jgi:putative ABC transport system ATP-binding protein
MREGHDLAELGAGDFFGEGALITGEPRNATVVANDNLDTYVLGKTDFRAAIEASANFRDQLYRVYFVRH